MTLTPSTRRLFSYVPQGNTMFSGTIAENMRNVQPDATDDDIIEALKASCAWEFVKKLPNGIYSKIGERGTGFSEGQAQRLSIARALLRHAPILLLDEATSALDNITQKHVSDSLKNLKSTRIVIAHRLSTIKECDRIIVLDKGRIIEDGTYQSLSKAGGFFSELVERQKI